MISKRMNTDARRTADGSAGGATDGRGRRGPRPLLRRGNGGASGPNGSEATTGAPYGSPFGVRLPACVALAALGALLTRAAVDAVQLWAADLDAAALAALGLDRAIEGAVAGGELVALSLAGVAVCGGGYAVARVVAWAARRSLRAA